MDEPDVGAAAQEVLRDTFGRISGLVAEVCDGLSQEQARYRSDPDSNSVAWLVWHLARVQDDHVAGIAGAEQVWSGADWYGRFGLPFDVSEHGYGHTADDVAKVDVDPALLAGYHADVHEATLRYVDGLGRGELARVVDDTWDPPVTVSVRLVSVIGDCLQHVGQAAYVRGVAARAGVV